MLTVPDRAGPHNPDAEIPDRRPNSLRRTSHIDSIRPDPRDFATVVHARPRDLYTDAGGDARVLGEAELSVDVRADSTIAEIAAEPGEALLAELIDAVNGPGFRGA